MRFRRPAAAARPQAPCAWWRQPKPSLPLGRRYARTAAPWPRGDCGEGVGGRASSKRRRPRRHERSPGEPPTMTDARWRTSRMNEALVGDALVQVSQSESVRTLALNRSKALNSFTVPLHYALCAALEDAAADVRCAALCSPAPDKPSAQSRFSPTRALPASGCAGRVKAFFSVKRARFRAGRGAQEEERCRNLRCIGCPLPRSYLIRDQSAIAKFHKPCFYISDFNL